MSTTAVTEASEVRTKSHVIGDELIAIYWAQFQTPFYHKGSSFYYNIMNALLPSDDVKSADNINKRRYKRQGESRMTPAIMLRLYMKVIKTMIWGDAEDADHPLSKPNADPVNLTSFYCYIFIAEEMT
uniref:SFRICE_021585 n=1 Tax=Spodoptera frugiperda TaxID=7108 RepID=A0A2H1WMH9_SPOFR